MSLKIGIVGLPNVGKSTLFNALLKKQVAASANYPFTTIEPNVGVVEVPDDRLEVLAKVVVSENSKGQILNQVQDDKERKGWPPIVHAIVEFVDIAGLVKGAHKGEGLGNKFLSHIREVDAIVFVVRDFKNEDIIKTGENPKEDLEILKSELLLKDLETIDKVMGAKEKRDGIDIIRSLIEKSQWIADELGDDELEKIADLQLLSSKKYLVVVNSDEDKVAEETKEPKEPEVIRICAKMEEELSGLSKEEQEEYLKEVGVEKSGLEVLSSAAYKLLDLETFLTAGSKEVRAWTIRKGSLAPQAAGVIHTDFERGFIAADIVAFEKFLDAGGWKGAREKGFVRTIGKGEVMPDNSVVEFKFSV